MTYNKQNLPPALLTPPVQPQHPLAEEHWDRNWSIFAIASQWDDNRHGYLTAIAKWAHAVDPSVKAGSKPLTRQRIQFIRDRVSWALRDYSNGELGLEQTR